MPMNGDEIKNRILTCIPDAIVNIIPLKDDDDHFQAEIISSSFKGQSRIHQHRRVYEALGNALSGPLHALSIITKTPE
jgi:stress-induced morphogen